VLLQLRIRVLLLKLRQVNAGSSGSFIAFPVLVSRDREEMSVTGGVMIGQAQMVTISIFTRLLNYIHVTLLIKLALGLASNCEAFAPYLSGTADGEMTASATSFIVIRRSMAAR
jgi:hypothetical protein